MSDYTLVLRFAAKNDVDAWRFGNKLKKALDLGIDKTELSIVGRYLDVSGPVEMMFTRHVVKVTEL